MPGVKQYLEKLYDRHADAIFACLINLTRSESETRDLMQELFANLARKRLRLAFVRNERAYLLRSADHLFVSHIRRREARLKAEQEYSMEAPSFFENPDETANGVEAALASLPEEQRAVVYLKTWENLSFREIGSILKISPDTAASRHRYAMEKLERHFHALRHRENQETHAL